MNEKQINISTAKIKREKRIKKAIKIALLILILLLLIIYLVVGIIYNNGNFSITLDKDLYFQKSLIIYDDPDYKVFRTELFAESPESFDNISGKWLPEDIDNYEGSHNGDNYVAYSFYIENIGQDLTDYWSEINIEDVIKKVDEAVRIRVYKDGTPITYAKMSKNGKPEKDTVPFVEDELIVRNHVENFGPGDKHKYTIVLWLEGSDPDCNDNILGGEFKASMTFNSEFVKE